MPSTIQKTSTQTKTAIMYVFGVSLAASIAYFGLSSPTVPKPTGGIPIFNPPGYNQPGYYAPGYNGDGGLHWNSGATCAGEGYTFVPKITPLAQVPKSAVVKGFNRPLYWYGKDGKRYVFPNEKTYRTWYPSGSPCPEIYEIADGDLAQIPIGGNVTYRPGFRMIKITADPKVYAVQKGGMVRGIVNQSVAEQLYGPQWAKRVDDVPDAFFVNYIIGPEIKSVKDYSSSAQFNSVWNIDIDKGL